MPDKEGSDDEKTTKDVVNKKQKQMMNKEEYAIEMVRKIRKIKKKINPKAVFPPVAQSEIKNKVLTDIDNKNISPNIPSTVNKNPIKKKLQNNLDEEGYDIARDMGRVPKTKDKKDASSYPVSKEVRNMKGDTPMQKEFKKKYGKKATALDAVKQKYKGQMMDVKKEEFDLTQVAEAFGGHIVEMRKITKTTDRPYFRKRNVRKFDTDQQDESDFEQRALDDFLKQQNISANQNKKKVEVTIGRGRRGDRITGDVEPEPEKIKKPIRDRNRVLQKVRVAARKTKRPVQRLAKPLGKLAARNPFAAAIVGTDLLDRAGRMIPKPKPPKLDVGVVGRRTAG